MFPYDHNSDRFHMSPTDRRHVAEASPTVTIIWKPGFTTKKFPHCFGKRPLSLMKDYPSDVVHPTFKMLPTALSSALSVRAIMIFFFHYYSGKKVTSMFAAADEVRLFKFTFLDFKFCEVKAKD